MQETLARHEEDLERIKRWLPEIDEIVRPLWENIANEITATRDSTLEQDRFFLDCVRAGRPITAPGADLQEAVATMELAARIFGD